MGRDDMRALLGDAAEEVTEEQIDRMIDTCRWAEEYWPAGDSEDVRAAALAGVVQYLLGDITPEQAGHDLLAAREKVSWSLAAAQAVARVACEDGMTEVEAGRLLNLDRMTVRKARGK